MKEAFDFAVSICTDNRTGELLAMYFRIRKGKASRVKEFAHGSAFANYDRNGKLLGIEMLGPCQITALDKIAHEPRVKNFVKKHIPRELALA